MTAGRPREHNREQIAVDIVEWARKEDSINLCKFCALYDPPIPPNKISLWAKEDDKFRQAYETAKLFLGFRREEWLNSECLHVKAYDLNALTYDYFLKEQRNEQLEHESKLKKTETQYISEDIIAKFEAVNKQLSDAQEARKREAINNNADVKS